MAEGTQAFRGSPLDEVGATRRRHATAAASRAILLALAVAVIGLLYLLQLYSPLRLTPDAVIYLDAAGSLADGAGLPDTRYPPGYPALLALLDRAGAGAPWGFIGLNSLFLTIGLVAIYAVLRERLALTPNAALTCCMLTLLSVLFVKHSAMPLSDVPYFGLAGVALWLLVRAEDTAGRMRVIALAAAIVVIALATTVRMVGITLVPAIAWTALGRTRVMRIGGVLAHRSAKAILTAVATLLVAGALVVLTRTTYFHEARALYDAGGIVELLRTVVTFRLTEWGEVALNVPPDRLPGMLRWMLYPAGLLLCGTAIYGARVRRERFGALEVYAGCYALLLLVWPYYEARFWMPLVPLLFAWCAHAVAALRHHVLARLITRVYLVGFTAAGVAALGYSCWLTLSGTQFANRYGDEWQPTYRVAYGIPEPGDAPLVQPDVLRILQRYDPLAAFGGRQERDSRID